MCSTIKNYIIIGFYFLMGLSCNSREQNVKLPLSEEDTLEIRFKKWVKDTIPKISSAGLFKERQVILSKDSLLLQVKDKYEINYDSKFKDNNESIEYALDLLDRNNDRPKTPFHLDFWITTYYSNSMIPQADYEYDDEVNKFLVTTKDSLIDYTFIKGNMTNREAVARKAENQKIK